MLLWDKVMIIGGFELMMGNCYCNWDEQIVLEWTHHSIKPSQSSLVKLLWLSTELDIILSHLNICVPCADSVLETPWQARPKTHLCKREHKRKMAYKQLRTEIMGQNPSRQLKTQVCKSCCLMLSVGNEVSGRARTHCLFVINRIMPWLSYTCI